MIYSFIHLMRFKFKFKLFILFYSLIIEKLETMKIRIKHNMMLVRNLNGIWMVCYWWWSNWTKQTNHHRHHHYKINVEDVEDEEFCENSDEFWTKLMSASKLSYERSNMKSVGYCHKPLSNDFFISFMHLNVSANCSIW